MAKIEVRDRSGAAAGSVNLDEATFGIGAIGVMRAVDEVEVIAGKANVRRKRIVKRERSNIVILH